jgi:hypothetical protein
MQHMTLPSGKPLSYLTRNLLLCTTKKWSNLIHSVPVYDINQCNVPHVGECDLLVQVH